VVSTVQARAQRTRAAVALRLAWPPALVIAIWLSVARLGFAPLDEGLVASYSRRILEGQVPHRDIISVRPFGSAVLHLVDLAIPAPLFMTSRVIGIVEVVAYSLVFATFLFERGPLKWNVTESFAVAASALVNLNTFILTSWYTFDGLLAISAGLVLARSAVRTGSRRAEVAAMLCLGLAVTMKQSFVFAPLLGCVYLLPLDEPERRARALGALRRLAIAAIPFLIYLAWLSLAGGLADGISEMTSGRPVWGQRLFSELSLIPLVAVLTYGAVLLFAARPALRRFRWIAEVIFVAAILVITLHTELAYHGRWSIGVFWALVAVAVMRGLARRGWSGAGFTLLAIAWMAALSWGAPVPTLVAGTMGLCAIVLGVGDGMGLPNVRWAIAAAVAGFCVVAAVFVAGRRDFPYFDRPASQLSFDLGSVNHDFAGIRTNPLTGAYVRSIPECLRRYPARNVAILPDNPGLYVAFDLHNPFPIDWMYPPDYRGHSGKIVAAAQRLQRQGNYLVLFQTVSGFTLGGLRKLPVATRHDTPIMGAYDAALTEQLISTLRGRHIVCGSFLGIYARSTGDSSSTGEPPRRSDSVAASSTATT
jgi:hypothetical protein